MPAPKSKKASNGKSNSKLQTKEVQKKQSISSDPPVALSANTAVSSTKKPTTVVKKKHRFGARIYVSSYVKIFATFSDFVKSIKKLFHLDDEEVNDELSMLYSSLKDALATEVAAMQNIKGCKDRIEQLKRLRQDVERAKATAKQLKDQGITLDVPTPDFEYMDKTIKDSMDFIERLEAQLQELRKKQEKLEEDFVKNSKELVTKIKAMLSERNLQMTSEEIEHNLINVFSVLRHKIALEDQEKRGQTLGEMEKKVLESANLRALGALLGKEETSEEKK